MRYTNVEGDKTLWENGTWFVVGEDIVSLNIDVDTSLTVKGPQEDAL